MSPAFKISKYGDCVDVTGPGEKNTIYLILRGGICVFADERTYKIATKEVRRARWKKKKAEKKRLEDIEKGLIAPDEEEE